MKSDTIRLLTRNVFHLGLGQVASTALGVLLTMVQGRAFAPADFGILFTVSTITGFAYVLMDWGQGTYLVREMARGRVDEPEVLGSALLLRLAITACAAAGASAVMLAAGSDRHTVALLLLAVAATVPASIYAPLGCAFRGKDLMGVDAFSTIAGKALTVLTTAVALWLGGGLADVFIMQGVGNIAMLALGIIFAARLGIRLKSPVPDLLRELFRRGAPIAIFSFVIASQPVVDVAILSTLAGAAVVGSYGACRTISGIINSPLIIALTASFPELSRASRSLPDFRRLLQSIARVLFISAAFTSSALYLFAEHIVAIIYGHGRFELTISILRMSAVFIPLWSFAYLLSSAMSAIDRNKALLGISIARIMLCAIVGWFVIGFWQQSYGNGANALVLVSGLAEIPATIACLLILPKGTIGAATIINMLRSHLVAAATVAPFLLLQHPLGFFPLIPLFAVAFAITSMAARLVLPSDIRIAMDFVRARSSRAQTQHEAPLAPMHEQEAYVGEDHQR